MVDRHSTADGKRYLSAIKDVWSKRIVGSSIGSRLTARLAVAALDNSVMMRGGIAYCVVHIDRGSQFHSESFLCALARHRMAGSMGRVASCGDDAAMESIFSLLQKDVLNRKALGARDDFRFAITTWIARTYHWRRRQDGLGGLTPVKWGAAMPVTVMVSPSQGTVTGPGMAYLRESVKPRVL